MLNMTHRPCTVNPNSCAEDVNRGFELKIARALAKNRIPDGDLSGELAVTVRYYVRPGWVDVNDKASVVAKLVLEVKKTLNFPKSYNTEDVERVHTFLTSEEGSAWCK
jgi:hypothetical protein